MTEPSARTVAGRRYDAALHLLDRQIVDPDGRLAGNVDDLEFVEDGGGRLVLAALLTGPGALGPRLGGEQLGRWVVAIWRRLHPAEDPSPGRIPMEEVTHIDSAVHVARRNTELPTQGFEQWVLDHVISRIPGSRHDPE